MFPRMTLGALTLETYGLFAAAAAACAAGWLYSKRARMGLDEGAFWQAMWSIALASVVGAKALFVALAWEEFSSGRMSLWGDFRYGFVYFGGLAGAGLTGLCFARIKGLSFRRGADYFGVAVPFGHSIGRFGCLAAGCCYGRPTALPWGVGFTDPFCQTPPAFRGVPLHPIQLYEAAGLAAIAWLCAREVARVERGETGPGAGFRLFLGLYGAFRVAMDFFRGDGRPERFLGLSHQQGLALVCLAAACLFRSSAYREPPSS